MKVVASWVAVWLLAAAGWLAAGSAYASPPASHPFAKHFLALQVSSPEVGRQARVLSVAGNMLAHYGPDAIAIEVVAFGSGLRLLYADNPQRTRIESLMRQGVRFDACGNTLDSLQRKTGRRPKLDAGVVVVPAGVARLVELHEKGYAIVQP